MEKLFHSKSHFWLCYCSLLQIMNQCGTLQPCRPCALGDGLHRAMTVGMQISTTLTQHSSYTQNISQSAVCCRYFCHSPCRDCYWTPGSHYKVVGAKNTGIKKKPKVRQGWSFFSIFFLSALLSTLPLPIEQREGCQIWCQICFSVINFLDHKWTKGWAVILLCYADRLNPRLLASIHKLQTRKIRKIIPTSSQIPDF